jgi:hypothetical protein
VSDGAPFGSCGSSSKRSWRCCSTATSRTYRWRSPTPTKRGSPRPPVAAAARAAAETPRLTRRRRSRWPAPSSEAASRPGGHHEHRGARGRRSDTLGSGLRPTSALHHLRCKDVQSRASESCVFGLDKRVLQDCAILRNLSNLTRNEQVSGSSPLVGSLKSAHLKVKYTGKGNGRDASQPNLLQPYRNPLGPRGSPWRFGRARRRVLEVWSGGDRLAFEAAEEEL